MLIGRIRGKPVVYYESPYEARRMMSCIACSKYMPGRKCQVYGDCRADKKLGSEPVLFYPAAMDVLMSRFTTIENGDIDGLKQFESRR